MSRTRFSTGQKLYAAALDAALDELESIAINAGTVRAVPLVPFAANDVTTAFALVRADTGTPATPGSAQELLVTVGGYLQVAGADFTLSGTSLLTFVVAPPSGTAASALWLTVLTPFDLGFPNPLDGGTYPAADDAGPSDNLIDGGTF